MKIYIIIYFRGGGGGEWGLGILLGGIFLKILIKNIEKEKKNLIFMLYIVYNLGMKLVYYKNGFCRCNIFGENKIVKYDVYVDVKKKGFCLLLFN